MLFKFVFPKSREIFMFTVDAKEGTTNEDGRPISPTDLRTVHDWVIRPQLMQVEGVVEVNPIGGFEREILIALNPDKLLLFGLTQQDVINAVGKHNSNKGAGFTFHLLFVLSQTGCGKCKVSLQDNVIGKRHI